MAIDTKIDSNQAVYGEPSSYSIISPLLQSNADEEDGMACRAATRVPVAHSHRRLSKSCKVQLYWARELQPAVTTQRIKEILS